MITHIYMVLKNYAGAVFVKEYDYFKAQRGFEQKCGNSWQPVKATSIQHARKLGGKLVWTDGK